MFGKSNEEKNELIITDFEKFLHDTYDNSSVLKINQYDDEKNIIKSRIPTWDWESDLGEKIRTITRNYFEQRRTTEWEEKKALEHMQQERMEKEVRIKKTNYIDEKSKLTEKELLAEIIWHLENIRDNAKINSETMNDKLNTISSATLDSKYELEAQTQADKKHRKDNAGPSWEF